MVLFADSKIKYIWLPNSRGRAVVTKWVEQGGWDLRDRTSRLSGGCGSGGMWAIGLIEGGSVLVIVWDYFRYAVGAIFSELCNV